MNERVEEIRLDREGIAHFLNEQHQGWYDGMGSLSQTRVYGTALLLADAVRAALAQAEAENERLRADVGYWQQIAADQREHIGSSGIAYLEQLRARIAALEADLAFLGATRTEDGLRIDMRKYHAAHGTDPARVAALEEALRALVHAIDCMHTIYGKQYVDQWWAKTRVHLDRARAALPAPTPHYHDDACYAVDHNGRVQMVCAWSEPPTPGDGAGR